MNTLNTSNPSARPARNRPGLALAVLGVAASAAFLAAPAAQAEDRGSWINPGWTATPWYVGAAYGRSHISDFNNSFGGADTERNDDTYSLNVGYQLNRNFAVELDYTDFGEFKVNTATSQGHWRADGWGLRAVGILPMDNRWSFYGKAGAFYADTRLSLAGADASDKTTHGTVGLGVSYDFGNRLVGKLEWNYYQDVGNSSTGKPNLNTYTLGVAYRF